MNTELNEIEPFMQAPIYHCLLSLTITKKTPNQKVESLDNPKINVLRTEVHDERL